MSYSVHSGLAGQIRSCFTWPLLECPRGVMVKTMNNRIVISDFWLQSPYYVHFRTNTLRKGMSILILPTMGWIVPQLSSRRMGLALNNLRRLICYQTKKPGLYLKQDHFMRRSSSFMNVRLNSVSKIAYLHQQDLFFGCQKSEHIPCPRLFFHSYIYR